MQRKEDVEEKEMEKKLMKLTVEELRDMEEIRHRY